MDEVDPAEVARLRDAVDNLAARVGASPAHVEPDRVWRGNCEPRLYAEWDVVFNPRIRGLRQLAVRAGWPDEVPGVFLVDEVGDMFALGVRDTHRLIEALTAAVAHVTDDLARQRALVSDRKGKPCRHP